jgi:hypothetical protein
MKKLLLVMLLIPALGQAHTPYTKEECNAFSEVVKVIAEARDSGRSLPENKEAIQSAVGQGYLLDVDDLEMTFKAADIVYARSDLSPAVLSVSAKTACYSHFQVSARKTGPTT